MVKILKICRKLTVSFANYAIGFILVEEVSPEYFAQATENTSQTIENVRLVDKFIL